MIVMINGAFGAGKTTLAQTLCARRPDWLLFDPEEVGALLWQIAPEPRGDFQELAAWAPLVVETARVLVATYGRPLVVPMTLVDPVNYATIRRGFETIAPTHHFSLLLSKASIAARLTARGSDPWAFDQIDRCIAALRDEAFAIHLDAERSVEALSDEVSQRLGETWDT